MRQVESDDGKVPDRKCKRVSGDKTTCSKTRYLWGVRDTSGEPVADNTYEEQQLTGGSRNVL